MSTNLSTNRVSTAFATSDSSRFISKVALTVSFTLAAALLTPTNVVSQVSASQVSASQVSTGSTQFEHAPRLVGATTNQLAAFVSGGTYEFTLTVPQNAGAPLAAVTISQEPNAPKIQFETNQSRVTANGVTVPLTSIGGAGSDEITIAFDRPIQPGSTVKISLQAQQSPGSEGVYLFGVTAYPAGEQTNGLFLGYGRVSLFSNAH